MATAYKSMSKLADLSNLDTDMSDDIPSEESSHTLHGDYPSDSEVERDAQSDSRPVESTKLPLELRSRILMLTSRGVSYRHRHFLNDLHLLLPHSYKDTKLDTKSSNNYNSALNALADLHSCNYVFFLEARKHGQDLYLWLARAPNGPTVKFSVSNVHTMGELGFGGNCIKGGRGVVVFDKSFDDQMGGSECTYLMREMLRGVFCVPSKGARGMKPFIDRVVGVYGLDGKIWIRVYEIRESDKKSEEMQKLGTEISLVEVGPRFVLTPVVVLEGSFGGPVIFENREFVSGNQVRSDARLRQAGKYSRRRDEAEKFVTKKNNLRMDDGHSRRTLRNEALFA